MKSRGQKMYRWAAAGLCGLLILGFASCGSKEVKVKPATLSPQARKMGQLDQQMFQRQIAQTRRLRQQMQQHRARVQATK